MVSLHLRLFHICLWSFWGFLCGRFVSLWAHFACLTIVGCFMILFGLQSFWASSLSSCLVEFWFLMWQTCVSFLILCVRVDFGPLYNPPVRFLSQSCISLQWRRVSFCSFPRVLGAVLHVFYGRFSSHFNSVSHWDNSISGLNWMKFKLDYFLNIFLYYHFLVLCLIALNSSLRIWYTMWKLTKQPDIPS